MITTAAPAAMASIHDRMPAILSSAEIPRYLAHEPWTIRTYDGSLAVKPCPSPLARTGMRSEQQELF